MVMGTAILKLLLCGIKQISKLFEVDVNQGSDYRGREYNYRFGEEWKDTLELEKQREMCLFTCTYFLVLFATRT